MVFLSGVGGIGKSELAAQYARDQAEAGKTVVRMFYHPGEPKAEDPVEASGLQRLLLDMTVLDDPEFAGLSPEDGGARVLPAEAPAAPAAVQPGYPPGD